MWPKQEFPHTIPQIDILIAGIFTIASHGVVYDIVLPSLKSILDLTMNNMDNLWKDSDIWWQIIAS